MPQVTIGPQFFKKEFKDYENWHYAIVREFMQNSIDAKSKHISITLQPQAENTLLIVENDGEVMTKDILINKLLALGESGKNFTEGSIGGFGKAKIILYYAHAQYEIRSGSLKVTGCGGDYQLEENAEYHPGTISFVTIEGDVVDELTENLEKFAKYAQWNGTLTLHTPESDKELHCNQKKGSYRRDLGFGKVYTNKDGAYRYVVRIGGIPMFTQYASINRLVVVELEGVSDQVLTSNRDGLVHPYRGELANFITEIAVDNKTALKRAADVPRYERFRGAKLGHRKQKETLEELNVHNLVALHQEFGNETENGNWAEIVEYLPSGEQVKTPVLPVPSVNLGSVSLGYAPSISHGTVSEGVTERSVTIGSEFIIKNESGLVVPAYYRPDSAAFSSFSRKLIRVWGRLLVELHRLFDHEAEFGVGFLFEDGDTLAQFEGNGPYGDVYYIAPAKMVEQSATYSKSFRKQWKLTDRNKLLATATHELIHGRGFSWHNEEFASEFTRTIGVVMDNRSRFNWCFK